MNKNSRFSTFATLCTSLPSYLFNSFSMITWQLSLPSLPSPPQWPFNLFCCQHAQLLSMSFPFFFFNLRRNMKWRWIGNLNGYFLPNVVSAMLVMQQPLSEASHVSQIAIFFHVPPLPLLCHTPENTKFLCCIGERWISKWITHSNTNFIELLFKMNFLKNMIIISFHI